MTEPIILDQRKEEHEGNLVTVIVFEDGDTGEICRLITDSYLNEWVEVVA